MQLVPFRAFTSSANSCASIAPGIAGLTGHHFLLNILRLAFQEEIHTETERGAAMRVEEYKKVISMAVESEIEAYDFYTAAGEKVKDANLKSTFKDLADEEKKHRNFLQGLLSQAKPLRFDEAKDYKISETVDKPKLSLGMKPADAIALAMKNEEEAMNMYAELAKCSSDKEQKEMFESLARMEKGHKVKLEGVYTNIAFPEVW
jgi:rubrerythrin